MFILLLKRCLGSQVGLIVIPCKLYLQHIMRVTVMGEGNKTEKKYRLLCGLSSES